MVLLTVGVSAFVTVMVYKVIFVTGRFLNKQWKDIQDLLEGKEVTLGKVIFNPLFFIPFTYLTYQVIKEKYGITTAYFTALGLGASYFYLKPKFAEG